jgi:hypothetical protein
MFGGFAEIQVFCNRAKNPQAKIFEWGPAIIIYRKGVAWEFGSIY